VLENTLNKMVARTSQVAASKAAEEEGLSAMVC
jgi:hypothetical protein